MKHLVFLVSLALIYHSSFCQKDISGITPAEKIEIADQELSFKGAGLHEEYFLDFYVSSLYVRSKSKDAATLINTDESIAITLDIVSGLFTSDKMIYFLDEGFESLADNKMATLKNKIESLKSVFKVEIVEGDHFILAYIQGSGTEIYKNGKKIKTIVGLEFKQALFGIWLGKNASDQDMKVRMLGLD